MRSNFAVINRLAFIIQLYIVWEIFIWDFVPQQTNHMNNPLNTLTEFESKQAGAKGFIYSLPALAKSGFDVSRLPVSIRIVLESVLRNCDGKLATEDDVKTPRRVERAESR